MKRNAQSTIEYFFILGTIVTALISMQVYLKRSIQGRLKAHAEELTAGLTYSPGATNSFFRITTDIQENTTSINNTTNTTVIINQTTYREEKILPFANEPQRW